MRLESIKKLFEDDQLYQTWGTCFDVFILKRKNENNKNPL